MLAEIPYLDTINQVNLFEFVNTDLLFDNRK